APDRLGDLALAVVEGGEREEAELVAQGLASGLLLHRRRPLSHQRHGGLAVAHGGGLSVLVGERRAQVALLERLELDQLLEVLGGLHEASAGEVGLLRRLLDALYADLA